jgi:DNA-binding MarR family transcriptional regulator
MDVAQSTASRLVARAERAGAVTRKASPEDHRRVVVAPTPAGKRLAETGLEFRLAILQRATSDWTAAERQAFADLLTRFARNTDTKGTS